MLEFITRLFKTRPASRHTASTESFPGIVAAKVLEVRKHPNADRLRVVRLQAGERIIEPVVCGAWNFEAGDMVALALPGAVIPHNIHSEAREAFTLGKATIRGIESQGMICAESELGLGPLSDKPEIMKLKPEIRPGSEFKPEMVQ